MILSGDWLTPRLAGYFYFEKPPLQYWATASAFRLFGLSEWSARLWPALTGLFCLAFVRFAGNRLFPRGAGDIAALLLGSSFLYFGLGHINNLDMGPTAFLGIALASFALAQRNRDAPAANRNWMLACHASMGFAVLSKGLIGIVLPGLGILDATPDMLRRSIPFMLGAGGILATGGGATFLALRRLPGAKVTVALAFVWIIALQILLAGSIGFSPMQSSRDLARKMRPFFEPGTVVFSVDCYDQSLPFYLDRTVVVVKRLGELTFGIEREPEKWLPDLPAFADVWARSASPLAVVSLKRVPELEAMGLGLREITRDHHRVVYAKANIGAR